MKPGGSSLRSFERPWKGEAHSSSSQGITDATFSLVRNHPTRGLFTFSAASLLVSVAACAPATQPMGAMPVSTDSRGAQEMPQPPGSLPPGAAVNAPVTSPVGNVSTTGVPARRGY